MADMTALLPNGMMDRMPDSAEAEARACATMQEIFRSFGYRLVSPPLLEFEETLLAEGSGKALSTNTFRLMDPVSQRMMALRSDATAQVARIAASRLPDAPRPLRLSYIADVLRIRPTQLRPERQFRQAGCELIGGSQDLSSEIVLMSLLSLHRCGVRDISIDFAAPEILRQIVKNSKQADRIRKASERRDRAAFEDLGAAGKILIALDGMTGPASHFLKMKRQSVLPKAIGDILDRLETAIRELQKVLTVYGLDRDATITVDPIETRGFEYQLFPCFTLFSKSVSGELGRGGSYLSAFGNASELASGFTLYLDSVLRAVPVSTVPRAVLVATKTAWPDIVRLQDEGWAVIRGDGAVDEKTAKAIGATHILIRNGLKEI